MDPAFAVAQVGSKAGVVLAALTAAAVLVDPTARRRPAWMLAALTLAAVILVTHIADTDQFRSISANGARLAALSTVAVAGVAALAVLFVQRPAALAPAAVLALPFRVPVEAAGATANLLVPLYAVIAAGCAAALWQVARDRAALHSGAGERDRSVASQRPGALEAALAAFVVVYALQALYSRDFDAALEHIVFFLVPFAVLFRLLADLRWTRGLLAACLGVAVALALAFAAIGFWEYDQRELLWNPKVIAANQFESYFRVNSVFWDPNIYGRFLMLVMIAVAAAMLWSRRALAAAAAAAVLATLWGGLVLTLSQSSVAGLLAGLAVLAALRWNPRRAAVLVAAGLVAATGFVLAFQDTLKIDLGSSAGRNKVTSGRADLIEGGLELFGQRPVTGHGSGAFGRAFRLERQGNQQQAVSASHTLPVTVAAEQGLIGVAFYLAVLAASVVTLLAGLRPGLPASGRSPPAPAGLPAGTESIFMTPGRVAIAAMYGGLLVHTMVYAAFLEDPLTWTLLAIGLALAARPRPAGSDGPRPRRAAQPAAA